ncbi:uncharacterized protein LOC119454075 [Dermacentor silvarum]|uniref:uncharacterized protein LOC119454075 n=1 Tax=Dermacentor silvarum TaxID=543639 RepID=UPI002101BDFF|nr:uncharacterized protein LOC119454075 [Dermacentor silvarum]
MNEVLCGRREDEENRKVSFVVCCNLILFIIMIILLMLLFMQYSCEYSDTDSLVIIYNALASSDEHHRQRTSYNALDTGYDHTGGDNPNGDDDAADETVDDPSAAAATTNDSGLELYAKLDDSDYKTAHDDIDVDNPLTFRLFRSRDMPGNYTLICVFEALRQVLWNKSYTCTDYVYIRFFTYSHDNDPTVQVVFEKKKLKSGLVKMYYDDSAEEWRQYSYRALDNRVRTAIGRHPGTRWFLGLWGSAYMRLMSGLFHASVVQKALHDALRSNFSDKVNMSYFHGFAIINSIIRDTRPLGRSFNFSDIFRGHTHGTPILDPSWSLIHTAAIFPFGPAVVPESMVKHILEEADLVGISTANTTDEPNLLMDNVENTAPYLFASPPNPIMPPGPNTRGMLDILKEFPHWKNVLNRSRLCFSVTTSINYAHTDVDGIDFVRDVRQNEDVQRYSRRRFVAFNATTKLPVEKKLMVYHYDNVTHTHYWRRLPPGEKLLSFFAYDMAETLKYKVEQLLNAYPDDRCVVFDDLGEDGLGASFTVEYCIRVAVHCLTYASSSLFVVSAEGALCDQLRDYAVDLNPYRKTLEVFLMLSMLTTCLGVAGYCILSYLIVEYFFASGGLLHVAETEMEVCTDDACGEYEHRTMGFVDWKGSPCENYFKYACSGFQKEAVDLNFAVYRPHNEVVDIEYGILIELLFQDGSDQWPSKVLELHNTARQAYRLCRASEGEWGIRCLYSAFLSNSQMDARFRPIICS